MCPPTRSSPDCAPSSRISPGAPVSEVGAGRQGRRTPVQRAVPVHAARQRPAELYNWAPKLLAALQQAGELADVNSDQQQNGLAANLVIDRDSVSRLGLSADAIDNTLYDAFGQRQVSTIYNPLNQYHVVMEVAPEYWQSPEALKGIYISTAPVTATGSQTTNAPAGTVAVPRQAPARTTPASVASDAARNAA